MYSHQSGGLITDSHVPPGNGAKEIRIFNKFGIMSRYTIQSRYNCAFSSAFEFTSSVGPSST